MTCRRLLHFYDTALKEKIVAAHSHPFSQCELILKGPVYARIKGKTKAKRINSGELLFIPPGTVHSFYYPAGKESWLTIRYTLENEQTEVSVLTKEESSGLFESLQRLLPAGDPSQDKITASEHVLQALHSLITETGITTSKPDVTDRIQEYISNNAEAPLTLTDVADEFGYSTGRLSVLYRQKTGTTVKQEIDIRRAKFAEQLLKYSDLNVSEVAKRLDFPNVYSFSRFYKRVNGCPPSCVKD